MFYGRVFCGLRGGHFKRRTYSSRNGEGYKVWNCAERQKGKVGNGCKCRILKEIELEREICERLKWESFDEAGFAEQIDWVRVDQEGMEIKFKEDSEEEFV